MFNSSMEAADMHPLVKQRLTQKRSIFTPGGRMKMNIVPMFLNVFIPWGVFMFCCGVCSFYIMYAKPEVAWALLTCVFVLVAMSLCLARGARKWDPDPTWFTYSALVVGLMAVLGTVIGMNNFRTYAKPYYELQDLKKVQGVDASITPGKNVMDGGIFSFGPGNNIADDKSWHFHYHSTYCVAPIITNGTAPLGQTYDFWAVGKDCCSVSASDFRCGSWGSIKNSGGIRVLSGAELGYYRLAVQQSESLYNIMAPNPIFMTWSDNPVLEVEALNQMLFKNYLIVSAFAFILSFFLMSCATARFAFLGRGTSAYDTKFLDNDALNQGGYQQPVDFKPHMYTI